MSAPTSPSPRRRAARAPHGNRLPRTVRTLAASLAVTGALAGFSATVSAAPTTTPAPSGTATPAPSGTGSPTTTQAPSGTGTPTATSAPSGTGTPAPAPSGTNTPGASGSPGTSESASPAPSTSGSAAPSTPEAPAAGSSGTTTFAPYVDTSLTPAFDLVADAQATGAKEYNLAFITDGGSCTPKWGGTTDLGGNATANQIEDLRKAGGDVRISFGGQAGSELATTCSSAEAVADAYGKVVDQFKATKIDLDIEGGALPDTAANTRRAQAVAKLQQSHPGLKVSFTLPVMPEGLTQPGVDLLADAKKNGVDIEAVNIMAMDYGPSYTGDMGKYATDAATATQAQVAKALGVSDAWNKIALTPMIGVNDVAGETFSLDDAAEVAAFAKSKGLAWLSMWSATRDKQCADGGTSAQPTCSGVSQSEHAFAESLSQGLD